MKGQRYDPEKLKYPPKPPTRIQVLVSTFVGSFISIAIVASLTYNAQWFIDRNTPVMAGSFGASAVLIYGAIEAPLSQPRNVSRCLPPLFPSLLSFFVLSLSYVLILPYFCLHLIPILSYLYVNTQTKKQTNTVQLQFGHDIACSTFFLPLLLCLLFVMSN